MGNPHRGEISFEHDKKTYTMALDFYAQAMLQRQSKVPTHKFFARPMDEWGVDDLLQLFWASLFRRHRMTEEAVADLAEDLGMEKLAQVIGEAIEAAMPQKKGNGSLPPPEAEVSASKDS